MKSVHRVTSGCMVAAVITYCFIITSNKTAATASPWCCQQDKQPPQGAQASHLTQPGHAMPVYVCGSQCGGSLACIVSFHVVIWCDALMICFLFTAYSSCLVFLTFLPLFLAQTLSFMFPLPSACLHSVPLDLVRPFSPLQLSVLLQRCLWASVISSDNHKRLQRFSAGCSLPFCGINISQCFLFSPLKLRLDAALRVWRPAISSHKVKSLRLRPAGCLWDHAGSHLLLCEFIYT